MNTIEITTFCGKLRGRAYDDHTEYRGIRYAASKRWEYPIPITSWDGIYDALEYKDCSYQRRSFEEDSVCNKFYHKEFRNNMTFTYSEDSLYLNIWSPKNANNCPVLIYIHGGSFTGGSSNEAHISGVELAKQGILFVSFNYRLGPFGFCSHPALTDKDGICGNYGLYDQYTAIKWIRDHIASFGGNPCNITIMGQSAGAMSVDIHSSSPLEKDWFSGIVMSSGAGLQRFFLRPKSPEKTIKFWNVVLHEAHAASMEELRTVEPEILYYAWYAACKKVRFSQPYTLPVYDGRLLTKDSFRKYSMTDVPCMIGMTKSDIMPLIIKHTLKRWIKAANKTNDKRCYAYLFHHNLPGDDSGAWHSSDLLYFFSTLKNNWRPYTDSDYILSKQMSGCLAAFAKTGNPNQEALPKWEVGYKNPMIFDIEQES